MAARTYADYKKAFRKYTPPFAFVDLDFFDENIRQIIKRSGNKRIRVASKSLRCEALMKRILAASTAFQGMMCFTIAEALYLSQRGFDDLLIAYPSFDKPAIQALCQAKKNIYLMIDSIEQAHFLQDIAKENNAVLKVCLDLDMSSDFPGLHFGVWRSPINTPAQALALAQRLKDLPHLKLEALMGYEAQIAGLDDKNGLVRLLKKHSYQQVSKRRGEVVTALTQAGFELAIVNGGGTGSLEWTVTDPSITEVTVGSGFYASALFDHYQNFQHLPAAGFALPIVRQPKPHIYTCLGGGYVASGGVGKEKLPSAYLPSGSRLFATEGGGEVQTPIYYHGPEHLKLGDPIFLRHSKAGELCERFNTLLLLKDGQVIDEVNTYRGEGLCFL